MCDRLLVRVMLWASSLSLERRWWTECWKHAVPSWASGQRFACWPLKPLLLYLLGTGNAIRLADKDIHERKRESDGQIVYFKSGVWSISASSITDVCLNIIDDGIAAIREALDDEQLVLYRRAVLTWIPPESGDNKEDVNFVDMPTGLPIRREQRHVLSDTIPSFVRRVEFSVPVSNWGVLVLVNSGLNGVSSLI